MNAEEISGGGSTGDALVGEQFGEAGAVQPHVCRFGATIVRIHATTVAVAIVRHKGYGQCVSPARSVIYRCDYAT
ncbi:hypothetical protein Misp04_13860 [Micromonospora sp. NBRC 101691]|nr:hypothetical protein Misp04_13860 [Micromonospora sp. NBRC 101691]